MQRTDIAGPCPNAALVDYDASVEARIVVDPATLLPYSHEERVHWYVSLGKHPWDTILESDHLVSATSYAAD